MILKGRYITIIIAFLLPVFLIGTVFELHAQTGSDQSTGAGSKKKSYPPGTAWTLSMPLGQHQEATIDTLLYNYQRQFITALSTDAWASTGQFNGPGIDMVYFNREAPSYFFFNDAIERWLPTASRQKFYDVHIPMTLLSYNLTFGKVAKTDWLKAVFAGNINKQAGFGAWVDYPYTKGMYEAQATKMLAFGFTAYYTGDHYEMQALFNRYNHLNKESGGITNDLYITNPAEIQGGVTSVDEKSIPVNLTAAHNRVMGSDFYMSHAYKLGFHRDVTQEGDSVQRLEFVPVTKFIYSFDYRDNERFFINTAAPRVEDFWTTTYFNPEESHDDARYWSVTNTVGVELVEGFQKWAKFGLSAYAQYAIDKYWYSVEGAEELTESTPTDSELDELGLTPLPAGVNPFRKRMRHRLWVGGRLEKTKGTAIRYNADAKFGLLGDAIGEIDINGRLESRFRLGRDTVRIEAMGWLHNLSPNYMLQDYVGNHFAWHNSFGKIRSVRAEARLHIPWTRTTLRAGIENTQNLIYFNEAGRPAQHGGNVQVVSASIDQRLRFGIWNWNNTVTWQQSSRKDILPMPMLTVYSNMFLYFKAFRALTVQVGFDCNYYTSYKGYAYQPATMAFCQQGADAVELGNYPLFNVYLTCKLYKTRFFVMGTHINEGWFSKNYFALPHYPIDPVQFRCGLSIDFAN